jgi:SAM-dependent methyltransferase
MDLRERLGRGRDPLVPPRRIRRVGHADFASSGDALLGHLVTLGGLQPAERVLDVRCGWGVAARPLAGYLDADGRYDGFDVDREAIGWCRRRYRRHPNLRFTVADVHDRHFNPGGRYSAAEYRFAHADASVDVVLMASVLTRLLEAEAEHHLAEAARVLAPGGRVLAGVFLLDDDSRAAIAEGRAGLPFLDPGQHVAVLSEELPDEAVAYDTRWLQERLADGGLELATVQQGSWSGREDAGSFEDLVVARRP